MSEQHIFSINPGRSGSKYLSVLFGYAVGTTSMHEPFPTTFQQMAEFNEGKHQQMKLVAKKKAERISHCRSRTYVETSHAFIKGFGWFIPEFLNNISVILLRRDRQRVASSLACGVSTDHPLFRLYYLDPKSKGKHLASSGYDNKYEWYVDEIWTRADVYRKRFPQIRYYDVELESLNNRENVLEMFEFLGLKPLPTIDKVIGKHVNVGRPH